MTDEIVLGGIAADGINGLHKINEGKLYRTHNDFYVTNKRIICTKEKHPTLHFFNPLKGFQARQVDLNNLPLDEKIRIIKTLDEMKNYQIFKDDIVKIELQKGLGFWESITKNQPADPRMVISCKGGKEVKYLIVGGRTVLDTLTELLQRFYPATINHL